MEIERMATNLSNKETTPGKVLAGLRDISKENKLPEEP